MHWRCCTCRLLDSSWISEFFIKHIYHQYDKRTPAVSHNLLSLSVALSIQTVKSKNIVVNPVACVFYWPHHQPFQVDIYSHLDTPISSGVWLFEYCTIVESGPESRPYYTPATESMPRRQSKSWAAKILALFLLHCPTWYLLVGKG